MAQCIAKIAEMAIQPISEMKYTKVPSVIVDLLIIVGLTQKKELPISKTCQPIASGTYGRVYKSIPDNVAWKVFHSPAHFLFEAARIILLLTRINESKTWTSVPQPEACILPTEFYIDIEHEQFMIGSRFAPGIELFDYLLKILKKGDTYFDSHQEEIKSVALKTSTKLYTIIDWLKLIGVVHGDLKLENIIVHFKNGVFYLWLIDWGLVKILPHRHSSINDILPKYWPRTGTSGYVPPLLEDINEYHDKFSVAALVAYMMNGHTQIPLRKIVQFFEEEIEQSNDPVEKEQFMTLKYAIKCEPEPRQNRKRPRENYNNQNVPTRKRSRK